MPTTNVTLRIPNDTLESIDEAAKAAAQTRSDYILSWCPQHYTAEDLAYREQLERDAMYAELLG